MTTLEIDFTQNYKNGQRLALKKQSGTLKTKTMIYLIQGGGRDKFPFFPEQPGNGNGNPPPYETPAPIDAGIPIIIGLALVLILTYEIWNRWKH